MRRGKTVDEENWINSHLISLLFSPIVSPRVTVRSLSPVSLPSPHVKPPWEYGDYFILNAGESARNYRPKRNLHAFVSDGDLPTKRDLFLRRISHAEWPRGTFLQMLVSNQLQSPAA